MSHPPIPPELIKRGLFFDFSEAESEWCFLPQGTSVWAPLSHIVRESSYRKRLFEEVKALCEISWRKRAERAEKVCLFYFEERRKGRGFGMVPNDYENWPDRLKWERAHNELQKATDAIEAWRTWGQSK